jgi:hypothetical protein
MISQRLRLGVSIWQQTQFMTLYRLFLGRVVDLEILSKEADTTRLVAQFMTILSGISLLLALPVLLAMGGVGAEEAWTPEHFFIATTLFVVGGVSVMSWDAALPDRLDVLVLATLPVRMSTLFAAKVLALFSAPGSQWYRSMRLPGSFGRFCLCRAVIDSCTPCARGPHIGSR